jgi:hypothetical protein
MAPDDDKTKTHVTLTGGTMVSHYRIIEKIGAGGMGEVYLDGDRYPLDRDQDRRSTLRRIPHAIARTAMSRCRKGARVAVLPSDDYYQVLQQAAADYIVRPSSRRIRRALRMKVIGILLIRMTSGRQE